MTNYFRVRQLDLVVNARDRERERVYLFIYSTEA